MVSVWQRVTDRSDNQLEEVESERDDAYYADGEIGEKRRRFKQELSNELNIALNQLQSLNPPI